MPIWILLIIIVILVAVVALRNSNHDYTMGKNLFKNSDNNLERDKHLDPSDYEYYNKDDKLK